MSWMITATGRKVHPDDLAVADIAIDDIAHHLSMLCRFAGAVREFYSVATHSVLVADLVRERARGQVPQAELVELELQGLLHDAAEAYLCDLPTPVKDQLGEYKAMERGAWMAIADRFGLPHGHHPHVKHADLVALATEKRDLMPHHAEPWSVLEGIAPHAFRRCRSVAPAIAKAAFLERFYGLLGDRAVDAARSVA